MTPQDKIFENETTKSKKENNRIKSRQLNTQKFNEISSSNLYSPNQQTALNNSKTPSYEHLSSNTLLKFQTPSKTSSSTKNSNIRSLNYTTNYFENLKKTCGSLVNSTKKELISQNGSYNGIEGSRSLLNLTSSNKKEKYSEKEETIIGNILQKIGNTNLNSKKSSPSIKGTYVPKINTIKISTPKQLGFNTSRNLYSERKESSRSSYSTHRSTNSVAHPMSVKIDLIGDSITKDIFSSAYSSTLLSRRNSSDSSQKTKNQVKTIQCDTSRSKSKNQVRMIDINEL